MCDPRTEQPWNANITVVLGDDVRVEGLGFDGKLRGEQITFSAGGVDYFARVTGETMQLEARKGGSGRWTATRVRG